MTTRRTVLRFAGAAAFGALPWRTALAGSATGAEAISASALPQSAQKALAKSDRVYITPLKKGDVESTCHAEVWFVFDGTDVFVVTSSTAWRARAIGRGLTRARLWVGEYGEWKSARDAYRKAPELLATGELIHDSAVHASVLERFGHKYSLEWLVWGPRFRDGLNEGSRVMLRYHPVA